MAMAATAVVGTNAVASSKEPAQPVLFRSHSGTGVSELHRATVAASGRKRPRRPSGRYAERRSASRCSEAASTPMNVDALSTSTRTTSSMPANPLATDTCSFMTSRAA
jgi:hypothetical protein